MSTARLPKSAAWPGTDGTEPLAAAEATRLAHAFHVLADAARVRILSLASLEPEGITVKALVAELAGLIAPQRSPAGPRTARR